jgi:hypothetical protein
MPISSPSLLAALPLNQGPFPPPALPGFFGNTGLSAIPRSPASPSRVAGWFDFRRSTAWDFPCCHRSPFANMPSPLPRRTRAVLLSLSSCTMSAFPVLKPGRHSHRLVSGLAQYSFALRPARSLTPFSGAFYIEGFGRFVASAPASTASGWSESCRVGFVYDSPTGVLRLSHGALQPPATAL